MVLRKVATALIAIIALAPTGELAAATKKSPPSRAEEATVNLYCRIKIGNRTFSTSGSGVIVHESGIILTNAHVAQYFLLASSTSRTKSDCSVRDGSPAREHYDAVLLYLSPEWANMIVEASSKKQPTKGTGEYDFALLRITRARKGPLPDTFPALPPKTDINFLVDGDTVAVRGYPTQDRNFKEIQKKLARVSASTTITAFTSFERPHRDLISLAASAASASGVSGGPVLDGSGELLGIVATMKETGPKDDRSLRAISLHYIDRILRAVTLRSLHDHLSITSAGTFDQYAPPFTELKKTIERTLRNTRR